MRRSLGCRLHSSSIAVLNLLIEAIWTSFFLNYFSGLISSLSNFSIVALEILQRHLSLIDCKLKGCFAIFLHECTGFIVPFCFDMVFKTFLFAVRFVGKYFSPCSSILKCRLPAIRGFLVLELFYDRYLFSALVC